MSTSEAFSCSTRVSSSAINKQGRVRPLQGTSNGYSTRQQRTFVLVAERLVLAHQLVALRLHVLDFVMVLGFDWSMAECFWPLRVLPPMLPPGALYRRILGASQIFCRDLSTTSCSRQQLLFGYSALMAVDYSRVPIVYLHPLLGPAHRLQVARYNRRVDEIVRHKLDPTTTSRGHPGHRRRTNRLRILNLWRMGDYFQV
jgi:hypothetical protein